MFAALLLGLLVTVYVIRRILTYSRKLPPGPINIPLLGSWDFLQLCRSNGRLEDLCRQLGDKYGPIILFRIALDTPVVVIRTYEVLKEAARDMRLYGMTGTHLYRIAGGNGALGVSFADGDRWHHNRKFTVATFGRLSFGRSRLEAVANAECSKVAENLLQLKGQVVNIEREVTVAIANVTLKILLNHEFEPHDPQILRLKDAIFEAVLALTHIQTHLDFVPWIAHISGKNSAVKTLERSLDELYDFVQPMIDEHAETLDESHPRDFIDAFLLQARRGGHDTSIANLRVMLKDFVLGAVEPTPLMCSWTLLLLAEHPQAQERALAELVSVLGPHRSATVADERLCPYTMAVIEETLRFVTMTPVNRHFTSTGGTWLRGYWIPAGAVVLNDQHSLHHDPLVWGDPDVFRPERFLGERGAQLRERVRAFGIGPRACPAEAHSRSVLFVFTAGLLRRVKFQLPEEEQLTTSDVYYVANRPSQTLVVPHPRE